MRQFDRAASSLLKSTWEMNKQKEKVSEKLCGLRFSYLKFWMVWGWQPRLYSLKRNKFPNWKIESFHFYASSYITPTVKNHRQPDNHKNSRFCSRKKNTFSPFSPWPKINYFFYRIGSQARILVLNWIEGYVSFHESIFSYQLGKSGAWGTKSWVQQVSPLLSIPAKHCCLTWIIIKLEHEQKIWISGWRLEIR